MVKTLTFLDRKEEISIGFWGFHPNRQVKPVHFANGFFRAICGQRGDIDLLQKAAAGYRSGKNLSNEQFVPLIKEKYTVQEDGVDLSAATSNLRSALDLILSQDKAFFPGFTSSVTLTHFMHTSSDPSDNGTGAFLAEVLAEVLDAEAIQVLRNCLSKKSDNIYLLTGPLLKEKEMGPVPSASDETKKVIEQSPHLKSIQEAFSRLVMYESKLEKTVFLQRIVTLGCFALYLHLTNKRSDTEIQNRGFVPILLTSINPSIEIKEASRASYSRGRQQIEIGFEEAFRDELRKRDELGKSKDEYIDLLKSWLPNLDQTTKNGIKETSIWFRFIEDFEGNLFGTTETSEAFVKACVRAAFSVKESPESFSQFIGKNIGLVYPREGGKGEKYYLPGSQFLDTLVVSLLEPDEEMSFEKFWEKAWNEFGIVCGARSTLDVGRLNKWGIRQATPKQLSQNSRKIKSELIKMGYIREYADDIAVIRGGGIPNEH